MNEHLTVLIVTAASLGFIHTLIGVDHYVPFIALSKAFNWTKLKALGITALCGVGHVLSTVLIGMIGIVLGLSLEKLDFIENSRGEIAGWLLLGFGVIYTIYGLFYPKFNKRHKHSHFHLEDKAFHEHEHNHVEIDHKHTHNTEQKISGWILFIIFVFGPCEALIPLLMIPAVQHSYIGLVLVVLVYGITTILTMLIMVYAGILGLSLIPIKKFEKHLHTLAGLTILLCGVGVQFLGL